jgi:hypothetical protein
MQQNVRVIRFVSLFLLSALCVCSGEKTNSQSVNQVGVAGDTGFADLRRPAPVSQRRPAPASQSAATGCDASLWAHVYSPKRLQQVAPCISVTGTIEESNVDEDGDQHLLLKLDPGQDKLLNKRNEKKKSGDIVLEVVCANPTTQKKPKAACAGYTNPIRLPAVGEHVKATGTYVIDTHNGWAEIHPVSTFSK